MQDRNITKNFQRNEAVQVPPQNTGNVRRRRTSDLSVEEALKLLETERKNHPFWENKLFNACKAGILTTEDFAFLFSQYYLYSRNFTRYLAGLMSTCEDDFLRAKLSENLWEEGGGNEPEQRHSQIFREFLTNGLGIDLEKIRFLESSKMFVREYVDFCSRAHPCAASAFLSFGTEGIVPPMYKIFMEGLQKAGIPQKHLRFFEIHVECDDEHAETLAQIMTSYYYLPDWYGMCRQAMNHALELRKRFFNRLYDMLQYERVTHTIEKIQERKSLASGSMQLLYNSSKQAPALYQNKVDRLNIEFKVDSVPFKCEVLDPRVIRIPPKKFNEKHRHAHETVFHIVKGTGSVLVDDTIVQVHEGDTIFVPRWSMHQSQNHGEEEMVILAITDYGLTGKAFIGHYHSTARMQLHSKSQVQPSDQELASLPIK